MATTRSATTVWHGSLFEGSGHVELVSFGPRRLRRLLGVAGAEADGKPGPELIAAAHSSCFSMMERPEQGRRVRRRRRTHRRRHVPAG